MARKLKRRVKDVAKFGGTEELGKVQLNGHEHEAATVEVQSQTKLEQDEGSGGAVVIRCFIFGLNAEMFKRVRPDKQQIFNSHYKGIETSLWKDGWKVYPEVNPRVVIEPERMRYLIYVAAKPVRGHTLHQEPLTLGEALEPING